MYNEYGLADGFFGNQQGIQTNPFTRPDKRNKQMVMNHMVSREVWMDVLTSAIYNMLLSRFEWSGLPDTMPLYFLEQQLVRHGKALIYKDPTDGIFVSSGTTEGINIYNQPTHFNIVTPTKTGRYNLMDNSCVLVKNDMEMRGDYYKIRAFVKILVDLKVTQGVNMQTMKTPFFITANEKTKASMQEQLYQVMSGSTHIIVDRELYEDGGSSEVFNMQTPDTIASLQQHYMDTKSELLEIMGINTNPNPKKERMITGEVESNAQETAINREVRLRLREDAARRASEIFGTKITVKLNEVFDYEFSNGIDSLGYNDRSNSGMEGEGRQQS